MLQWPHTSTISDKTANNLLYRLIQQTLIGDVTTPYIKVAKIIVINVQD